MSPDQQFWNYSAEYKISWWNLWWSSPGWYAICFAKFYMLFVFPIPSIPQLHTTAFTHTDAVPQRGLCTETFLQSNGSTQRSFGAQWKIPSHRRLYKEKRLHGAAFTHKRFYAQELLDTEAFTHRTFCTEKPLLRTNFATHLDVRHARSPQSVSPSHLKRGLQELALQVFSHSLVGAQRSWSLTCPRRRWCKSERKQCRCSVWVLKELIEADHLRICTCVDDVQIKHKMYIYICIWQLYIYKTLYVISKALGVHRSW